MPVCSILYSIYMRSCGITILLPNGLPLIEWAQISAPLKLRPLDVFLGPLTPNAPHYSPIYFWNLSSKVSGICLIPSFNPASSLSNQKSNQISSLQLQSTLKWSEEEQGLGFRILFSFPKILGALPLFSSRSDLDECVLILGFFITTDCRCADLGKGDCIIKISW